MYRVPPDRAWWPAVGAPLERGVRRQRGATFHALPSPNEALHFGQSFDAIGMLEEQFGQVPIGPAGTGAVASGSFGADADETGLNEVGAALAWPFSKSRISVSSAIL